MKKYVSSFLLPFFVFSALAPSAFFYKTPLTRAASFTVDTTNDSGEGSLRQAILDAEANVGPDLIDFDVAVSGGTIVLLSLLPELHESTTIDASTLHNVQVGPDITIIGSSSDDYYVIGTNGGSGYEFKGLAINGQGGGCLTLGGGSDILVEGNLMTGCDRGISIEYSSNVTISNNLLEGNRTSGINLIGSTDINLEGNKIVNNSSWGIMASGENISIQNNFVGTKTGFDDQGNGLDGILIDIGSHDVMVEDNLISGNGGSGLVFWDGTSNCTATNNRIGTNANGMAALSNGGYGIMTNGAADIDGNLISGNIGGGILLQIGGGSNVHENIIGLNALGGSAIPNEGPWGGVAITSSNNSISSNTISGNTNNGIYINGSWNETSANLINGNNIGTNPAGNKVLPNGASGIFVGNQVDSVTIGDNSDTSIQTIAFDDGQSAIQIDGVDTRKVEVQKNRFIRNSLNINSPVVSLINGGNSGISSSDITIAMANISQISGSSTVPGSVVSLYKSSYSLGYIIDEWFADAPVESTLNWIYTGTQTPGSGLYLVTSSDGSSSDSSGFTIRRR